MSCLSYDYKFGPCRLNKQLVQSDTCTQYAPGYDMDAVIPCDWTKNIKGNQIQCKKEACSNDLVGCCTTGIPTDGYTNCNSAIQPANAVCSETMKTFCTGDKLFTNGNCAQFCGSANGIDWCKTAKQQYCVGDNLDTNNCKEFCFSAGNSCDTPLTNYCAMDGNLDKKICQCFLPADVYTKYYTDLEGKIPAAVKAQLKFADQLPVCNYPGCSTSSYKPTTTGPVICPTNCFQNVFVDSTGDIVVGTINTTQTCNINAPVSCSATVACPSGYSCDLTNGYCNKQPDTPPAKCTTDTDCPGQKCSNGTCVALPTKCTTDSDCPGQKCTNGTCVALPTKCTTDTDCPGQKCTNGACVAPPAGCTVDSDCGFGETCDTGQCSKKKLYIYVGVGALLIILLIILLVAIFS